MPRIAKKKAVKKTGKAKVKKKVAKKLKVAYFDKIIERPVFVDKIVEVEKESIVHVEKPYLVEIPALYACTVCKKAPTMHCYGGKLLIMCKTCQIQIDICTLDQSKKDLNLFPYFYYAIKKWYTLTSHLGLKADKIAIEKKTEEDIQE